MTKAEALALTAMVGAYFPGRLTEETARAWALELETHHREDGIAAVRALGRGARHPSLSDLFEHLRHAKQAREADENARRPRIAAHAEVTDGARRRDRVAKEVACDMALRRLAPGTDFTEELNRRLSVAEEDA